MDIKIVKANETEGNIKKQISEIFVEGFWQWLKYFSKDKTRLINAFEHIFQLDSFYVAILDEKVVGITACTNGKKPCVHLQAKVLRKNLGFVAGSIAASVLRKELENHPYPFELEPTTGSIEFVATHMDYRGKGVASTLIEEIIKNNEYKEFVLEVADTNTNAVKLYEKLGFVEIKRVKMHNSKRSGINFLVYMKYIKY
ncbi:MAG: N-acetyltransferase [Mobilitalea sp.]